MGVLTDSLLLLSSIYPMKKNTTNPFIFIIDILPREVTNIAQVYAGLVLSYVGVDLLLFHGSFTKININQTLSFIR